MGVFDEAKDKVAEKTTGVTGEDQGSDADKTDEPTDPTPAPPDEDDSAPIADDPEERNR